MDNRNVTDFYKYWDHDAIVADLDSKRHDFVVVVERVNGDFNFSNVIRSGNAFLAKKIWRTGIRKYDKRGTVGTHHYEHVDYHESLYDLINEHRAQGYTIVAIDNVYDSVDMTTFAWPTKTLMLFGEEGRGLSDEALVMCDEIVYIPQYGSVRSLNLGTAAGIAMYDYTSKITTP